MIRMAAACALLVASSPAAAQSIWTPLRPAEAERVQGPEVASGTTATLRALDKVSGDVEDLVLQTGETGHYGRLSVQLLSCRYPVENPASDAFAYLVIRDDNREERLFEGWMFASAPALNALDHARYDVWVLGCE
jgi:hypothetical protein